jgi:peptidoglycan-N-acetylglucosamine deacetylase
MRRQRAAAVLALPVITLAALVVGIDAGEGSQPAEPAPAARTTTAPRAPAPRPVQRREEQAIDRAIATVPYLVHGGEGRRDVALTFDDGPGPYTPRLLQLLRAEHAPATFFWVGKSVRDFRAAAAEEVREGFAIGDHTETHPHMAVLPAPLQRLQIEVEAARQGSLGLPAPRLFRPPYRSFSPATLSVLRPLRMLMALWSVDSQDYRRPGRDAIVRRVLAGARPGAIVLLHDAGGDRSQTLAAVPEIVRGLRQRGYRLTTVPELLLDDQPPREQTVPPQGGA